MSANGGPAEDVDDFPGHGHPSSTQEEDTQAGDHDPERGRSEAVCALSLLRLPLELNIPRLLIAPETLRDTLSHVSDLERDPWIPRFCVRGHSPKKIHIVPIELERSVRVGVDQIQLTEEQVSILHGLGIWTADRAVVVPTGSGQRMPPKEYPDQPGILTSLNDLTTGTAPSCPTRFLRARCR
jgi:hypothetical protein